MGFLGDLSFFWRFWESWDFGFFRVKGFRYDVVLVSLCWFSFCLSLAFGSLVSPSLVIGATAVDAENGNLAALITACSDDFVKFKFDIRGVQNCGVDPNVAGVYNITFGVMDSQGLSSTVIRKVIIKPQCVNGEKLCSDGVTCSEGGACIDDLAG